MFKRPLTHVVLSVLTFMAVLLRHGERYVDRTPDTDWEAYYQLFIQGNWLLLVAALYLIASVYLLVKSRRTTGR
jgi:hypothetical protein